MPNLTVTIIPVLTDNYIFILRHELMGITVCVDPAEAGSVLDFLKEKNWKLNAIWNTHHHADHIGGNLKLKKETGCQIIGSAIEKNKTPGIDQTVQEGSKVFVGDIEFTVLEIPGHTLGHIAFYSEKEKLLFSGDTIFSLGCGRLFEGTAQQMWDSLSRIGNLPDETKIYCTHEYTLDNSRFALIAEPDNSALVKEVDSIKQMRQQGQFTVPTTVAKENKLNPFLRAHSQTIRSLLHLPNAKDVDVFAKLRKNKDEFK